MMGWGRNRETSNDIFTIVVQEKKHYLTIKSVCWREFSYITKCKGDFCKSLLEKFQYCEGENL